MTGPLLDGLRRDTAARLKWRVCSLLGVAPYSREWRRLTRRRVLLCALHLVLDRRRENAGGTGNPGFDEARFLELGRTAE